MRFLPVFICFFIFIISVFSYAQSISIISYGIEDNKVFVRWKSSDTNKVFSVYRSQRFITNQRELTNYAIKIGTFRGNELNYKNGYLYYYDSNPFLGTNYYLVFENNGTNDIFDFVAEQNFSISFVFFIPLPKVTTSFSDLGNVMISWDKIDGVDGYLVYKVDTNFHGIFDNTKPIASLPKEENILIDAVPNNKSFFYVVVPFFKGITNFSYSKENNGVFVAFSKEILPQKTLQEVISQENTNENFNYGTTITNPNYLLSATNVVYLTNTNLVYVTNYVTNNITNIIHSNNNATNENYNVGGVGHQDGVGYQVGDEDEIKDKIKEIVSSKFNKGMYKSARKDFKNLLTEVKDMGFEEMEAKIMIYIARCDYALGDKDEAIKTLLKAKKVLPDEADFWLTRFLVNSH